jgi:hypothetical protein
MDATIRILVVLLVIGGVVFVIYAWAKGWLRGSGARGSFTGQVIMHDMLNQSKQKAMEYHMDGEEEKEKRDAMLGEPEEPGGEEGQDQKRP